MAVYTYNFHGTYVKSGDILAAIDGDPADGVLSNGEEGDVISNGETLANSTDAGPENSIFSGYYVHEGNTIVFGFHNGHHYAWTHVGNPATYTFPNPLSVSDVSIADFTACFLQGVRIATPVGLRPVETLSIGDVVCGPDRREITVKWVGRQTIETAFGPREPHWPVLIRAGALAPGLPVDDLRLTADHAIDMGGLLVQAGALVNGDTIRRMTKSELGRRYVVYHLETEGHELILGEGVACETFLDTVSRRRFDNWAEYVALYGSSPVMMAERDLPRIKSPRQLPRLLRQTLRDRSHALALTRAA
jgi:hypothetical protein